MAFPQFLKIASLSRFTTVGRNKSFTSENIFDFVENELIRIIASTLGFSYELVSPADGEIGTRLENGSWNGMMGMVERGKADLIIHSLSISLWKAQTLDFTPPYAVKRLTFATTRPKQTTDITSFLSPFSYEVWYCILLYVIVKILTTFLLQNPRVYRQNRRVDFCLRNARKNLLTSIYGFADAFLNYFYAAVLLAFLTIPTLTGVRTIRDLSTAVLKGTHQCAYSQISFAPDDLPRHFSSIRRSLEKWRGPSAAENALIQSNSSLKVAFFDAESHLLALSKGFYVCREPLGYTLRAVGVRRDFCCKPRLDSLIHYIWASGIYEKLLNDAQLKMSMWTSTMHLPEDSVNRSLSVIDFRGVFILLFAGHALAVVVFILELAVFKCSKKRC